VSRLSPGTTAKCRLDGRRAHRILASVLLFVPLLVALPRVSANPGDVDASFGNGGVVTVPLGNGALVGAIGTTQAENIVVVGSVFGDNVDGVLADCFVARFGPSGSLDTSFGRGGIVTTTGMRCRADALALGRDGKILVSGVASSPGGTLIDRFMLMRLEPNGDLDQTFQGGTVLTAIPGFNPAYTSMVVEPGDDRPVVAGTDEQHLVVIRYDTDGAVDRDGFGVAGIVNVPLEPFLPPVGVPAFYQIALSGISAMRTGHLVVTASLCDFGRFPQPHCNLIRWRYSADGQPDTTFGGGVAFDNTQLIDTTFVQAIQQPDEKIVAVGQSSRDGYSELIIVRNNASEGIDPTFGVAGITTTRVRNAQESEAASVVVQPDGKLIVGAFVEELSIAIVRYDATGNLDPSFGQGGVATVAIADRLALQGDKLLTGGGGTERIALARYKLYVRCGDGVKEGDEQCDGGECCTPDCRFRGPTEPCAGITPVCQEPRVCTGTQSECPTRPTFMSRGEPCFPDESCTIGACDGLGKCDPRGAVCRAMSKVAKNGSRNVRVKVACRSDTATNCSARMVLASDIEGSLRSFRDHAVLSDDITEVQEANTRRIKGSKGLLKYKKVLVLRLNERGRQLLRRADVRGRVEATFKRQGRELHAPPLLVHLLRILRSNNQ